MTDWRMTDWLMTLEEADELQAEMGKVKVDLPDDCAHYSVEDWCVWIWDRMMTVCESLGIPGRYAETAVESFKDVRLDPNPFPDVCLAFCTVQMFTSWAILDHRHGINRGNE